MIKKSYIKVDVAIKLGIIGLGEMILVPILHSLYI